MDYNHLYNFFLSVGNHHIDQEKLNLIKGQYKDVINSNRAYERITSLEGLLDVLETRGVLERNDIKPLQTIARNYIDDVTLSKELEVYDDRLRSNSVIIDLYAGKLEPVEDVEVVGRAEVEVRQSLIHEIHQGHRWDISSGRKTFFVAIALITLLIPITYYLVNARGTYSPREAVAPVSGSNAGVQDVRWGSEGIADFRNRGIQNLGMMV